MPRAVPLATYRLQLTAQFGFADAAKLVPYLAALGVSHLYLSPITQARPGSSHGYDVIDHNKLSADLGARRGFDELSDAATQADIGLILDFVPNHVGIGHGVNAWWLDVLEWGQKSPHAKSFDIEWNAFPERRSGVVLMPILGKPYGDALEEGEIELRYDSSEGAFSVWYFDHRVPISPADYAEIVERAVAASASGKPAGRLREIAARYRKAKRMTREQAAELKSALKQVEGGGDILERGLSAYRARKDDSERTQALHNLLERQHYRLAHWRLAATAINYRRFFDITDLAGLRIEERQTFDAVHGLVAELVAEGRLHGLRLDHIDGLYNPRQYCRRLQQLVRSWEDKSGGSARPSRAQPFYVVVEKILADEEPMPDLPGVAGTTGYETANLLARVLVDADGLPGLRQFAAEITGQGSFAETVHAAKTRVLDTMLASEFTALLRLICRIAGEHWKSRDIPPSHLREALRLYVLHFPVYRTYVTEAGASDEDRRTIDGAIAAARPGAPQIEDGVFDFLRAALTLDLIANTRGGYDTARLRRFALKVQQFTGPLMAKALEDTALYRDVGLLALNEVGGDPSLPGLPVAEFHRRVAERGRSFPHAMNATATHDTKRGEDNRARLLALSEMSQEWRERVSEWRGVSEKFVAPAPKRSPSLTHEYMLYQALLGAWPLEGVGEDFVTRMGAYAVKAAREGKQETSWLAPDEAYEAGLLSFLRSLLRSKEFPALFDPFARRIALIGALNGLAQLALKATIPGVPDFYQGSEFWDLSLVDPDNRRPVDFARRQKALSEIGGASARPHTDWRALAAGWSDGRIKLALTQRLLAIRNELPRVFLDGDYEPVEVAGADRDHVIAFTRRSGKSGAIVAVLRCFATLTDGGRRWMSPRELQAHLVLDRWRGLVDMLEGGRSFAESPISAAALFDSLPVAVLQGEAR
jgi:(1->4)-alpha-D-glucan 1-alpha-D-glucosylmutase